MIRAATFLAAALLTGCSSGPGDIALCYPEMPQPSRILSDPVFSALKYHIHQSPNWHRPLASDLWADAKFEYTTGVQYASAPVRAPKSPEDFCAFSISMRFMLPPRPEDRRKLQVFAQSIASATKVDPSQLQARLAEVLDGADKFRERPLAGAASLEAGKLYHPARGGEFFMVTVEWPMPQEASPAR